MSRLANFIDRIRIKFMSNSSYINYLRNLGVKIGNGCVISKNAVFGTEPYLIEIGDNVRITENVSFITHDGSLWVVRNLKEEFKDADKIGRIIIRNNVNIGWNTILMPGTIIGENCIVGAGSIVTKSIPDNSVAAGVPCRVLCDIDTYIEKNIDSFVFTKNFSRENKKKYLLNFFKI